MRYRNVVTGIIILLCGALFLQGCGNANRAEINLTMQAWGNPTEIEVYRQALDAYTELRPDVSIELIPIPSDGYEQKLFTQLTGGSGPDVMYVGDGYMSRVVDGNAAVPLTEFLESSESYTEADSYAEGLWGAARRGDEIYGVPVDSNPLVMYYNLDLFDEFDIPTPQEYYDRGEWNWDAFMEVTTRLNEAGKQGFVQENTLTTIYSWVWSNGGRIYDDEGNFLLPDNEEAQEAIGFIHEMITSGNALYAGSLPEGQGLDAMFMSLQVGLVAAGRWLTPMFDEYGLNFDYISWPTNTGEEREPVAVPTAYMIVNANSNQQEEAMKFLSYYVSREGQTDRLSGIGNAIPSMMGIDDIVSEIPEHLEYLTESRDTGFAMGSPQARDALTPGLVNELENTYELMMLDQATPEQTIEAVIQRVENLAGGGAEDAR